MKKYLFFIFIITCSAVIYSSCNQTSGSPDKPVVIATQPVKDTVWHAPDTSSWASDANGELIRYGYKLISNTSYYLGPQGTVAHLSNGMNCQNCHIHAGTHPYGSNFGMVAVSGPTFRPRSGKVESHTERVNDCIQRSLNGMPLDTASREMQAIVAYILWVGKDVHKGDQPKGIGVGQLSFINRATDTVNGKNIYIQKCASCHAANGAGLANGTGYQYPPLWGEHSYSNGASMYRIGKLANYAKNNMPFGTTYQNPQLTDEEAWDVAAYINSKRRPEFNMSHDWPNIADKPIDYPLGPYKDGFSETQHKYGPYQTILEARKKQRSNKTT